MKKFIFLLAFIFISSETVMPNKSPLPIIQCLLTSDILIKDIQKIIELFKSGKKIEEIIFPIISMYPEIYSEVTRCLNAEITLFASNEQCILNTDEIKTWKLECPKGGRNYLYQNRNLPNIVDLCKKFAPKSLRESNCPKIKKIMQTCSVYFA